MCMDIQSNGIVDMIAELKEYMIPSSDTYLQCYVTTSAYRQVFTSLMFLT
jgi:hypothetical protein